MKFFNLKNNDDSYEYEIFEDSIRTGIKRSESDSSWTPQYRGEMVGVIRHNTDNYTLTMNTQRGKQTMHLDAASTEELYLVMRAYFARSCREDGKTTVRVFQEIDE